MVRFIFHVHIINNGSVLKLIYCIVDQRIQARFNSGDKISCHTHSN